MIVERDTDESDERRRVAWDPFEGLDDEPSPEELKRRLDAQLAHAASLDPNVAVCRTCHATTTEWVVRSGMDGSGFCRACVASRASECTFAREVVATFYEGMARLLQLREERNARIATELAEVPF